MPTSNCFAAKSGGALLNAAFSTITLEMLGGLMHKRSDGRFSARLKASVIGRIQIGDSHPVHNRLYDGRGGHARHAGKRVHIDDTIIAFFNKLQDGRDAHTGFRGDIEGKNVFLPEQLFQMTHFVIVFQINQPGGAFVELFLPHFLVEKIGAGADDFVKMSFQTTQVPLLKAKPKVNFILP